MPSKNPTSPSSRPKSTSSLTRALPSALAPAPPPSLSSFSSSSQFAAVLPSSIGGSAGKERLKVWDTDKDVVLGEWDLELDMGRIQGLVWVGLDVEEAETEVASAPVAHKKRRRNIAKIVDQSSGKTVKTDVIILVSSSHIQIYNPSVATPMLTFPLPTVSSSKPRVTAIAYSSEQSALIIGTSTHILVVNPSTGSVLTAQPLPSNFEAPSVLSVLSTSTNASALTLILGSTSLTSLTFALPLSPSTLGSFSTPQPTAISPIHTLLPISSSPGKFITAETDSRTASLWLLVPSSPQPFQLLASLSVPTITPIHSLALADAHLAALSSSGEVSVFSLALPDEVAGKKKKGVPSLEVVSEITIVEGKEARQVGVMALQFSRGKKVDEDVDMEAEEEESVEEIIMGRMGGGGRVGWEKVTFVDIQGAALPKVVIKKSVMDLAGPEAISSIPLKRFNSSNAPKQSIHAFSADASAILGREQMELPVEGDLADMTLGERLAVMEGGRNGLGGSESDDENTGGARRKSKAGKKAAGVAEDDEEEDDEDEETAQKVLPKQSTQSLTRLLSQALLSSDSALLSLILTSPSNSSQTLIRNTIRKMPASLALPLLKACVERLGRGKRWERRGGGRGGGVSAGMGRGVVAWIRGVLVERGTVLMTIPSLPVHLATLSQLLQSRLQLHEPLLALSGRLDLALAQIEARRSFTSSGQLQSQGTRYVEGESGDETSDDEVEIEQDTGEGQVEEVRVESRRDSKELLDEEEEDDEQPVKKSGKAKGKGKMNGTTLSEDVEMESVGSGAASNDGLDDESNSEEDEDEDEFDDEDDSDAGGNGFIDDEASEASEDEESDDMEE